MLEVGTKVKDFSLKDQTGKTHNLSDYRGKKVVIYFYPKDNTPGCTTQACGFRDLYETYVDNSVVLLGISSDGLSSHSQFVEQYQLPFVLLSDEAHVVSTYFGAWGEKNLYGKISTGMIRSTFILDEDGMVEKVYKRARAKSNPADVLSYLGF